MPQSSRISRSVLACRSSSLVKAAVAVGQAQLLPLGAAGAVGARFVSLSRQAWWAQGAGQPGLAETLGVATADDQVKGPSRSQSTAAQLQDQALSSRVGCRSRCLRGRRCAEPGLTQTAAQAACPSRSGSLFAVDQQAEAFLEAQGCRCRGAFDCSCKRLEHAFASAGSGVCPGFDE